MAQRAPLAVMPLQTVSVWREKQAPTAVRARIVRRAPTRARPVLLLARPAIQTPTRTTLGEPLYSIASAIPGTRGLTAAGYVRRAWWENTSRKVVTSTSAPPVRRTLTQVFLQRAPLSPIVFVTLGSRDQTAELAWWSHVQLDSTCQARVRRVLHLRTPPLPARAY